MKTADFEKEARAALKGVKGVKIRRSWATTS